MTGYHFPLALAMTCMSCESVFTAQRACPACTSDHIEAIENFLTRRRDAEQRRAFVADVEREMERLHV